MADSRFRVAALTMVAVVATLGAAQAAQTAVPPAPSVAEAANPVRYACDGRQGLIVTRFLNGALVEFIDRTYELQRKPSNIGEKYISETAALIIDGPSAVFVAEDRLQLGACVEATELSV